MANKPARHRLPSIGPTPLASCAMRRRSRFRQRDESCRCPCRDEEIHQPATSGSRIRESTPQLRQFALATNKLWSRSRGRCIYAPSVNAPWHAVGNMLLRSAAWHKFMKSPLERLQVQTPRSAILVAQFQ